MHRKLACLIGALAVMISFNSAMAQSSHDAAATAKTESTSRNSGTFEISSADGKYSVGLRGLLQENNQFSYSKQGATVTKKMKLEIKRARLSIYGSAFDPSLTFLLQTGYEGAGNDILRDYYVNKVVHDQYFQVRVGKFTSPFSRQLMTSAGKMQFFDQQVSSQAFKLTDSGQDVGIMLHNGSNNPLEWAFAVVANGLVGRLGYNHNNVDGFDMVDWTGGDLRFGVAANGFLRTDYGSTDLEDIRGSADFIVKIKGFSTNGAFYYQRFIARKGADAVNNFGAGIDLGYLINGNLEPVARYSWGKAAGETSPHGHQILGGLNYYVYGHHLKAQAYAGVDLMNSDMTGWTTGVQLQFAL